NPAANEDSLFNWFLSRAKEFDGLPIGQRVAEVGKLFLGKPYIGGTLDVDSAQERLILNFEGFDCVTFYENALAMARVIRKYDNPTIQQYKDELTFLRYRGGKMQGYASRLHYSIDYFRDGVKKR